MIDFLRYEGVYGRTVILLFPEDVDIDDFVTRALSFTPPADVIRLNVPDVVVHSATRSAMNFT